MTTVQPTLHLPSATTISFRNVSVGSHPTAITGSFHPTLAIVPPAPRRRGRWLRQLHLLLAHRTLRTFAKVSKSVLFNLSDVCSRFVAGSTRARSQTFTVAARALPPPSLSTDLTTPRRTPNNVCAYFSTVARRQKTAEDITIQSPVFEACELRLRNAHLTQHAEDAAKTKSGKQMVSCIGC